MKPISHFHPYRRVVVEPMLVLPIAEVAYDILNTRPDRYGVQNGANKYLIGSTTYYDDRQTPFRMLLVDSEPFLQPAHLFREDLRSRLEQVVKRVVADRALARNLRALEWRAQCTIDDAERQAILDAKYPDSHAIAFCA